MLVGLTEEDGFLFDIRYATSNNLLGRPIYSRPAALLRPEARHLLLNVAKRTSALGLSLKIYDAFRPLEVQWIFWEEVADKTFVGDPRQGGTHPRGIAVDLTLVDAGTQRELDMGTDFDSLTHLSSHDAVDGLTSEALRNRTILLGLMTSCGWVRYQPEWWHYNLPDTDAYMPLWAADVPGGPM